MVLCTIAIPVFNRERLIGRCLESALAQQVTGLEILVIDNCSSDQTWSVVNHYSDPRLRLVRNDRNLGLFGNFNRCLELARGKYLRFLCSDDALTESCLEREIAAMDLHPTASILTTRGQAIDSSGKQLYKFAKLFPAGLYGGSDAIAAALWLYAHYKYNPFNYPSGVLLRRECALRAGQFNTSMRMAADVEFFLKTLEYGDLFVQTECGCLAIVHEEQASAKLRGDDCTIREMYALLEKFRHHLGASGVYERVRKQMGAITLGLAWKCWAQGLNEASRKHYDIMADQGLTAVTSVLPLLRLLSYRVLHKLTGCVINVPGRSKPLSDKAISA